MSKILIVDDSLTVRMDLCEAFEAAGVAAIACGTVAEALALSVREDVGLAILDVMLPDGDGVSLLRALREAPATASLPVLMLSSEAEVADRIRGLSVGANEYVGKPYDTGYVVARSLQLLIPRGRVRERSQAPTVLLIDDSITFREALGDALLAEGYVVIAAADGEEGLRLAAERRPGAIIVDGVLPGVDGATVIRRVRFDAALRHTPCLLLTASDARDAELRAFEAGADAFVRKDDELAVILARLSAVMRGADDPVTADATASLLGPKKILTVDDSPTYLHELSAGLRGEGYDVVTARSGEEALQLLAVQSVDCILLDLLMPGLGGKETCKRIKAAPFARDIPLIMLTALEDHAAMIEGLGTGADDYISKSSDFEVLKARVRAQLRRKQLEGETRRTREALLHRELEIAEARAARQLAETRAALVEQLERKNRELEAFSYSVSHDLRAPLRSIDGFSQALLEDYDAVLDERGRDHLRRVRAAAQRMGQLIDDLLQLSRVGRAKISPQPVDLSGLARDVFATLAQAEPTRHVVRVVAEGLSARCDLHLVRIVLENLLGNAWKFTHKVRGPRIEVGQHADDTRQVFFVRDNGAGFDMRAAERLFRPFQRLHTTSDFAGTGIGLATVQRIVERHGGTVWAEAEVGKGACFFFTLAS